MYQCRECGRSARIKKNIHHKIDCVIMTVSYLYYSGNLKKGHHEYAELILETQITKSKDYSDNRE